MTDELRIVELVEEILNANSSAEEACGNDPHLLSAVKERLRQCRDVDAEIEELFPSTSLPSSALRRPLLSQTTMPMIPGYHLEAILGRGGMGVVYKATHLKLHRPVALKMLLSGDFASSSELTRFMREAEAVAALRHAHIVQIHDEGEFEGRPYFTMEFVEGGSLAQKLAAGPRPAREAATLVSTLADAVATAHRAGIVHRDLKPSNVLLNSDGTPKITDFGLASRRDGDPHLTRSGARVGTPSYMSPEQAGGTAPAFCPASDIYSLGAILYEMLTGHPPFQADTASETQRQVIAEEPAPPSRLNVKVPKDIETICLKCLRKAPERRYQTAGDLRDDLRRFLNGEPIHARPTGPIERTVKWVRRRPAMSLGLATSLLFAVAISAGAIWLNARASQRERAVAADLQEMVDLQARARWDDARGTLKRANARLDGGGSAMLRKQLDQARRDLQLVMDLDNIHLSRVTNGRLMYYRQQAARDYAKAFQQAGLLTVKASSTTAAAADIRASAVHDALLGAIDDWATCTVAGDERAWLLDVARRSDPDSHGWGDQIRQAESWNDLGSLTALTAHVPVRETPASLLLAVAERLKRAGGDPTAFMMRVQDAYPDNFWVNLVLGDLLLFKKPDEAGGYYRAALASRPLAAVGYSAVGDSLRLQKFPAEAIEYYQKALAIDPHYARAYTNLGNALSDVGRTDDAVGCYHKALEADPHYAWAYSDLGNTLRKAGRPEEAIEEYRQFLAIDSSFPAHYSNIGDVYRSLGKFDEAIDSYRLAMAGDFSDSWANLELGETLKQAGRLQEAVTMYQTFVAAHPQFAWGQTNLGNSLRDSGRVDEAIPCYKKAMALDPSYMWAYADLGTALRMKGQFEEAIADYQQFLTSEPANLQVLTSLRAVLMSNGRGEEACAAWGLLLQAHPTLPFEQWTGYPELCLYLGHVDTYRAARAAMLERFGSTADPFQAEPLARMCLLLPDDEEIVKKAAGMAERAVANKGVQETAYRYFLFAKALADFRQGKREEARRLLASGGGAARGMGPCPRLIVAMIEQQEGDGAKAKATMAAAIGRGDWTQAYADRRDRWIYHILRREAESMIH